jgi:hypothetical protein
VGTLEFDRARVDALRLGLLASVDELRAIRSDDTAAADTMRMLRSECRALEDTWLPRVHDILSSTSMTSCIRSTVGAIDIAQSVLHKGTHRGWEIKTDPLIVYGPPAPPQARSFEALLADMQSGALVPMAAPVDAHGRAGSHYTSLEFAPSEIREVGHVDLTPDVAKALDFISDGTAIGWREHHTLTIYYLTNARVMSSVHTLTAYDRDDGPETLLDQTTEATVSGYIAVEEVSTAGEVSMAIGSGDDTQSQVVAAQAITTFSGAFYPVEKPRFRKVSQEPRVVNPERWTFTKSAAPMVDGWGTWKPLDGRQ